MAVEAVAGLEIRTSPRLPDRAVEAVEQVHIFMGSFLPTN